MNLLPKGAEEVTNEHSKSIYLPDGYYSATFATVGGKESLINFYKEKSVCSVEGCKNIAPTSDLLFRFCYVHENEMKELYENYHSLEGWIGGDRSLYQKEYDARKFFISKMKEHSQKLYWTIKGHVDRDIFLRKKLGMLTPEEKELEEIKERQLKKKEEDWGLAFRPSDFVEDPTLKEEVQTINI